MGIILKPFALLLLFFYNFFQSYGIALILFALLVKLILFPLSIKGKKSMIQMNLLSGQMQQIQKQYGKDRERYNAEIQKLYAREKVNPMGGCLWSLMPLIILIPLYWIIREPVTYLMGVSSDLIGTVAEVTGVANSGAYPQIAMAEALGNPDILAKAQQALGDAGAGLFSMDFSFLGINLAAIPKWNFWTQGFSWGSIGLFLLPLVSTVISFLSMKVSMKTNQINQGQTADDMTNKTNQSMMIMMPLMSLWIGFTVPAGLSVYWIAQYIFTIGQELLSSKMLKKDYEAARLAAEKREQEEKEEEKRRKEEARLERQRRLEEEKKNRGKKKPKKLEPTEPGINREDSRIGIRAYARGRAYDPNRFGGVQPYRDPSDLMKAQAEASAAKKGKKGKKDSQAESKPAAQETPKEQERPQEEQPQLKQPEPAAAQPVEETAPVTETSETTPMETEEIEVEVEQIEEEIPENEDDKKEGV